MLAVWVWFNHVLEPMNYFLLLITQSFCAAYCCYRYYWRIDWYLPGDLCRRFVVNNFVVSGSIVFSLVALDAISTAAVYDWPTAAWITCMAPLLLVIPKYSKNLVPSSFGIGLSEFNCSNFYWLPRMMFLLFLAIQIPFVASRQILLIPASLLG